MSIQLNRRQFITAAGLAGVGLGLAACDAAPATPAATATPMDMNAPSGQGAVPAEDVDALHEAGIKTFLAGLAANAKTFWPQRLAFTMDGDVKVFNLTCKEVVWETRPGEKANLLSYNGVIPGPELRITEGDKVRVIVQNSMKESTTIHWHGIHVPNAMDGVGFITQPPIKPGQSFTYEFVAKPVGSHMYHSHHNAAEQVTRGLLGSIVVEPKDKSKDFKFDSDYTMVLNDTGVGLTINGKSFPATGAILAQKGEKVRVRFMNEGLIIHPWHLHGMYMQVVAQDGAPLPQPFLCDTLNIAPGQRFDVIIDCQAPGAWAFHCHVLTHAESPHGMFGMVTALIIT